jgi:hypothetical protein
MEIAIRQEEYQRQDEQRQTQMVNPFAQNPA